jgi:HK97 family phage portal protein
MLRNIFEKRAISYQTIWGSGDIPELQTNAGTLVNQDTVFTVNAIFGAVSLISDTISTLPVDSYIRRDGARLPWRPRPAWVTKPDVDTTKEAFYGATIVSLLLDGNAFIRIYRNGSGEVVNLVVLNPLEVEIKRNGLGRVMFKVTGERNLLSSDDMIFIPDVVKPGHIRGVSRVEALKENFGLARALENYAARFFGGGSQTAGVIEVPGTTPITAEQAKAMADAFDSRHRGWSRAHKTAVISGGATYKPTNVPNDQAQFLDSRRMAVEDVARAFNIPPHLLGLSETGMSYASVEQNNLAWVTHCLRPIVQKLESALSYLLQKETGNDRVFVKMNLDGLIRADINTRMTAYSIGLQSGFLTINECRALEDLRPIDDEMADTVRVPLANVNLDDSAVTADFTKIQMAQRLIQVGFEPAAVMQALELPNIAHTGAPSVQIQPLAQIDPNNPQSVYQVE